MVYPSPCPSFSFSHLSRFCFCSRIPTICRSNAEFFQSHNCDLVGFHPFYSFHVQPHTPSSCPNPDPDAVKPNRFLFPDSVRELKGSAQTFLDEPGAPILGMRRLGFLSRMTIKRRSTCLEHAALPSIGHCRQTQRENNRWRGRVTS